MQEAITLMAIASIVTPAIIAGLVQARNNVSSVRRSGSVVITAEPQVPPVSVDTISEAPKTMATPSTT